MMWERMCRKSGPNFSFQTRATVSWVISIASSAGRMGVVVPPISTR